MTDVARLVVTAGGEPRAFDAATLVVGRGDDCDVLVEGKLVSRRHCEVLLRSDGLWIRDLDSTHGTWIDGNRVTSPRRVPAGTRVRLGSTGPGIIVSSVGAVFPDAKPRRTAAYVFGVFVGAAATLAVLVFADAGAWIEAARGALGR